LSYTTKVDVIHSLILSRSATVSPQPINHCLPNDGEYTVARDIGVLSEYPKCYGIIDVAKACEKEANQEKF
jgi:hypothetical protein